MLDPYELYVLTRLRSVSRAERLEADEQAGRMARELSLAAGRGLALLRALVGLRRSPLSRVPAEAGRSAVESATRSMRR